MIVSILYKARPDEVKFIMIDSSVVDLSVYNGIPHLLIPVVTDVKKALETLQGVVSEMEKRQHRFAEIGVRNLKDYNEKIVNMPCAEGSKRQKTLPQLVIIINDLSDLMMEGYKEIEESVWRLALNASTVGIHLVISTQYSEVDVFTGLLKASIRSRVAFAVSKRIESRMILDMEGAEKLLGKGDMLFYPQGYMKPIRIQGAFVSDEEIGKVVDFIKDQKLTTDLDDTVKSETPGKVLGLGGVLNCIKFM